MNELPVGCLDDEALRLVQAFKFTVSGFLIYSRRGSTNAICFAPSVPHMNGHVNPGRYGI
jgi:hypothetical protein